MARSSSLIVRESQSPTAAETEPADRGCSITSVNKGRLDSLRSFPPCSQLSILPREGPVVELELMQESAAEAWSVVLL